MPFSASLFIVGPLIAFGVVAVLAAVLRWTFSDLSAAEEKAFGTEDYGLLRVAGTTDSEAEAHSVAEVLARAGIRATISTGRDGRVRVLVFESMAEEARRLVDGSAI